MTMMMTTIMITGPIITPAILSHLAFFAASSASAILPAAYEAWAYKTSRHNI